MRRRASLLLALCTAAFATAAADYFPDSTWQHREPAQSGKGRWGDRQLLSAEWVQRALTPTPVQPTYGFMNWFLNTDRKLYPSAPATAFAHIGNGVNVIYVDPEHDLVAVVRWIENKSIDGFLQRLLAAIR